MMAIKIRRNNKRKKKLQMKKMEINLKRIRMVMVKKMIDQLFKNGSSIRIIILVQKISWELLWHFVLVIMSTITKNQCKNLFIWIS
jgi:hypothetical protein